jgi:hypothetical protein
MGMSCCMTGHRKLELFEPSGFSSFEAWVDSEGLADIEALEQSCSGNAERNNS